MVLTVAGQPIAGALLDFWHADDDGECDNVGFTFWEKQYREEVLAGTIATDDAVEQFLQNVN